VPTRINGQTRAADFHSNSGRGAAPPHRDGALAAEHGQTIVPSADDRSVMAGAGIATLEPLRQAPGLSVILVPVGGAAWQPAPL
jgi:hypothetical protein